MNYWYMLIGFLMLLFVLVKISPTAKYHIKYIGYCLYCILLASLCGIFCIFQPGSSKNIFIAQFFMRLIRFEWVFGIDIRIEDWQKLKNAKKPFVVVSNHQTALDAIILMKASPNGTAPLAKKILLYVPIFGVVCWLCGTIFINRKKGKSAIEIMRKVGEEMKQKMRSVWIFPEGTRRQLDKVVSFKKGAFHLAIQANVPIVPVLMCNYRNVIDRKNRTFDGGVIRVKCLDPISTDNLTNDDATDLCDRVQKILADAFDDDMKSHPEIYSLMPPIKMD